MTTQNSKMAANESVGHYHTLKRVNHCAIYQQFKFQEPRVGSFKVEYFFIPEVGSFYFQLLVVLNFW